MKKRLKIGRTVYVLYIEIQELALRAEIREGMFLGEMDKRKEPMVDVTGYYAVQHEDEIGKRYVRMEDIFETEEEAKGYIAELWGRTKKQAH